ncbi:hypothetical protein LCGC14_2455820, partial [marine sediment metagenome]
SDPWNVVPDSTSTIALAPLADKLVLYNNYLDAKPRAYQSSSHIAWAGFQEFARQWVLLSRRSTYDPGSGAHRLWMSIGGSAGHGGLYGVDIDEGVYDPSTPRTWAVQVQDAADIRQACDEQKTAKKEARTKDRFQANVEKVIRTLAEFPEGETESVLKCRTKLHSDTWKPALQAAIDSGQAIPCKIRKGNGQTYDGVQPAGPVAAQGQSG